MENETHQIEEEKKVEGKIVLSFTKPTPVFATWAFRIIFILTGVAIFIVFSEPTIRDATKVRLGLYLKAFDMLIWGITRAIGVDISRDLDVPDLRKV